MTVYKPLTKAHFIRSVYVELIGCKNLRNLSVSNQVVPTHKSNFIRVSDYKRLRNS